MNRSQPKEFLRNKIEGKSSHIYILIVILCVHCVHLGIHHAPNQNKMDRLVVVWTVMIDTTGEIHQFAEDMKT